MGQNETPTTEPGVTPPGHHAVTVTKRNPYTQKDETATMFVSDELSKTDLDAMDTTTEYKGIGETAKVAREAKAQQDKAETDPA